MKIIVNDANIIIDLIKLDILSLFFELDFHFYTTDLIFGELHDYQKIELEKYEKSNKLKVLTLAEDELLTLMSLVSEKPQLSPQDCSALFCAQKMQGELITSDNNLRKFATSKKIIVHGHLWVLDMLFESKLIDGKTAIEVLELLTKRINPKLGLPVSECEKRRANWLSI